jgi:hypothetical protein
MINATSLSFSETQYNTKSLKKGVFFQKNLNFKKTNIKPNDKKKMAGCKEKVKS